MKAFTVREAVRAVGGTYYGDETALEKNITFVTSDSRAADDGALFVAFVGARSDGHDYMNDCLNKGAVCCLSEREPKAGETPCIVVDSTLRAIGALSAWHRSRFDIPVVGITGSVGKTTTKEMIAAVLSERFNTHKTEKNFNNELGVPQTLLRLDDAHEVSVVEMGISDFGEMRRLTHMVKPKIAVMSIIGDAHLEFLHDYAGVLRAKGEIVESMSEEDMVILNGDDATLKGFVPHTRRMTYGMNAGNDVTADNVHNLGAEGIACTVHCPEFSFEAKIPAFGVHMVYAALAATCVGITLGMTADEIASGIASYKTVGERARLIRTEALSVVSDCYNANPSSTNAAIRSLTMLEGRKVCILGDMLELGPDTKTLHASVGATAAQNGMLVLASGALSAYTARGAIEAGGNAVWFETRDALIAALGQWIRRGDSILVKASHSMQYERITKVLEEYR